MNKLAIGSEVVDLAPMFLALPERNYLLNALDLFDGVGITSPKVIVSQLVEDNYSLFNEPTARGSSEHNVTARQNGQEWLIEAPYFLREDMFTPADVQGKRKQGTAFEETVADLYAEYTAKHKIAYMRTRESYLARALFKGQVYTPKTNDLLIDYATLFGVSPMTHTVSAATPAKDLDDVLDKIQQAAGGLAGMIERIIVFAKPAAFSSLRFSDAMATAFQYVAPYDSRNIVFQRNELLPGVSTFSMPGSPIDVIKVTDPLLLAQMPDDADMIAIPVFSKGTGTSVYQVMYGAASSTFALLDAAPAEFYSWGYQNERGSEWNVITENTALPVNHGLGMQVKITLGA
ncbi:TPA: major capsid protein [Klebsiella pneumoniae]|uniref:major capsid protein n=1 Tax=Klebsiella pneumoniae TaxID=573 RepID=UPI001780792F|nr:major capsid protein [Klebsiella pneumoniae]EKW7371865.1 major capsid protein [Klebsiella pneumoniae]MBE0105970.1 phage capsid protein [Klebsiella pneumoniae]HBU7803509.1 major capsid protein [Klebsiella pneumoniae]